ncbi:MAG: hypothetical protein LC749_22945 [Actinobacteria bacterium]|nr:hypothetical protein [Actinomycetota bacterium]
MRVAWARQLDRWLDRRRARGHTLALAGVPVGVKVGEGVELVQARRLLGAGCIPIGATPGWGWLSLRGAPWKGCSG